MLACLNTIWSPTFMLTRDIFASFLLTWRVFLCDMKNQDIGQLFGDNGNLNCKKFEHLVVKPCANTPYSCICFSNSSSNLHLGIFSK